MCKVLKVSRSAYYKHLKREPSNRKIENERLSNHIIDIYKGSRKSYGAIKIYRVLISKGIKISLKRVQRLMKKLGIKSIIVKKYRLMKSNTKVENKENIIKRDFSTTSIFKNTIN
jgi:putative transposase